MNEVMLENAGYFKEPPEDKYPCDKCGKLRTKDEGGTVFTVCDECWEKHYKIERT